VFEWVGYLCFVVAWSEIYINDQFSFVRLILRLRLVARTGERRLSTTSWNDHKLRRPQAGKERSRLWSRKLSNAFKKYISTITTVATNTYLTRTVARKLAFADDKGVVKITKPRLEIPHPGSERHANARTPPSRGGVDPFATTACATNERLLTTTTTTTTNGSDDDGYLDRIAWFANYE
jgi:hypothetical protein